MKKLGILLGILCMLVCTFLLFFGDTAYNKWQEYNFQSDVKKIVEDGDKSELAKNSTVKSGWIGDKYVKVYYPNSNIEQTNEIKERLDDETKGLVEGNLNFDKDIKEIAFYGVVEKESNFAAVREVSAKKVSHKVESRKVESASESIISSIYLAKDNRVLLMDFDDSCNLTGRYNVTPKEETTVEKGKEVKTYKLGINQAYEKNLAGSIKSGFEQTLYYGTAIFMGIINLFASLFNGGFSLNQLGGPVAIYEMSSAAAQSGLITTLKWTGILSVNLGLMNLIPIPVLDGGRIIFVIYEAIFKKPINKKAQYYLTVAFGLLMVALMLAVTWNDIQRLFGK